MRGSSASALHADFWARGALGCEAESMLCAASQFKWLPVPANSSGAIGYCGLIDVQLTQDANATPRRFFAMISKGPSGEYSQGRIEHIEGVGRESGLTDENCKEWGYTDFSGAN